MVYNMPGMAETPTITPNQAKRHFLELGKGRTLRKVQAALCEHGGDAPTLRALGNWSVEGGWVKAAEEWDAKGHANGATPGRPLTARERRFVAEYLVDLNGTQAAIRARYSENRRRCRPRAC